jgi:AcrR family transcriptional regulator
MGKLLKRKSREETRRIERKRRQALLAAAARSFVHLPYSEVTLKAIGKRAGVPTGIAAVYFESKEELFLLALRSALEPWFEEITGELGASDEPTEAGSLARRIAGDLARRERVVRLLGLLHTAAEQNIDVASAMAFSDWLRERADRLGEAMERRCPGLKPGDGVRFLLRLQFLIAGVPRMASVSSSFAAAFQEAAPEAANADFAEVLESLATMLMPGPADG